MIERKAEFGRRSEASKNSCQFLQRAARLEMYVDGTTRDGGNLSERCAVKFEKLRLQFLHFRARRVQPTYFSYSFCIHAIRECRIVMLRRREAKWRNCRTRRVSLRHAVVFLFMTRYNRSTN